MKILVPIKRVVDPYVKVRVKADETDVELANLKMAINPFCEIAVEEAVRLKEKGHAEEIIVVSIGPKAAQEQLRTAMALGADRGILVEHDEALEPLSIAKVLKAVIDKEQPSLVLFGKQSIDGDNNQTAQMTAALAGMGQATFASCVELEGDQVKVAREIDGGIQTLSIKLPAVVSADLRLNEPRYASLPNIMKAKRKPLETVTVADFELQLKPHQKVIKVAAPAERSGGIMVGSVEELVDKLKNEAKVV
ncbi:electron transfer flavoprotein subunit beta/FixA family protein [Ferrimonas sediminicola]|uniref:Electron transfer flavoprotein subunit beta n=1 Tax=Ferrimonas sediminicola TaxID=2569538 RepID=A0A4U1BF81_9GAMM|nr:electron transfer flavoprotein subunit beta/FixA family protein [Ferrimonas sediminicola]TKB49767.1 electron transfer flavoprotein subunit beta/FixA family protein [Ferrimonas sediminicola]